MTRIFLIEDDRNQAHVIAYQLRNLKYNVQIFYDGESALEQFQQLKPELVISDYRLPGIDGIEVLKKIKQLDSEMVFIIITAHGNVDDAVKAVRNGADDYIMKPFSIEQLLFSIEKSMQLKRLRTENLQLRQRLKISPAFEQLIAVNNHMRELISMAKRIGKSDYTVLIEGESGTGKELFARGIHEVSSRQKGPFIAVNCAAIPGELIESELFGYEKGAFTGAFQRRIGKFEQAQGGTLFLDEIGDLHPSLQAKLLRVLQERTIERIGGKGSISVDIRVISATNQNLEELIARGRFREDLYYRLNVINLKIPPLRERPEDILPLFRFFLKKYSGREIKINHEVLEILHSYHWPGNVRELENVAQYATLTLEKNEVQVKNLPDHLYRKLPPLPAASGETLNLSEMEKHLIQKALEKTGGNKSRAARLLGIPRHKLLYKMNKLKITP